MLKNTKIFHSFFFMAKARGPQPGFALKRFLRYIFIFVTNGAVFAANVLCDQDY